MPGDLGGRINTGPKGPFLFIDRGNPPPRPSLLEGSTGEKSERKNFSIAMAIASNFRKYPEAQVRQLELDLSGVVDVSDVQHECFWAWLMNSCKVIVLPKLKLPEWVKAARRKARALAMSVKSSIKHLWLQMVA